MFYLSQVTLSITEPNEKKKWNYIFITDILKVKSKVFFFNWTNATEDGFGCLFSLVCRCERIDEKSLSSLLLSGGQVVSLFVHFHRALTSTTGQIFEKQLTWVISLWLWKRKKNLMFYIKIHISDFHWKSSDPDLHMETIG